MRTVLIVVILAAAGFIAWRLLNTESNSEADAAAAAEAALAQIGQNQLQEQQLKEQSQFYQLEYDECYAACKKSNCGLFARKCKGRCKTQCLQQLKDRYKHGLAPAAQVKDYNPLTA